MAKCPSSHSDEEKKKKNLRQRKKNGRKKGIKTVIKWEFILAGDECKWKLKMKIVRKRIKECVHDYMRAM